VAANGLINCLVKVLAQVETVRDLNRLRSTNAGRFCVLSPSVAADDLNRRITCEPSSGGLRAPVWEEIEPTVSFQVTDDGSVARAATPRPIIETDHARWLDWTVWEMS
jgi:hypothetical protein